MLTPKMEESQLFINSISESKANNKSMNQIKIK